MPKAPFFTEGRIDQAFGLVEQILRNVVGNIQDFLQHHAGVLDAILFPLVIGGESRTPDIRTISKQTMDFFTNPSRRDFKENIVSGVPLC